MKKLILILSILCIVLLTGCRSSIQNESASNKNTAINDCNQCTEGTLDCDGTTLNKACENVGNNCFRWVTYNRQNSPQCMDQIGCIRDCGEDTVKCAGETLIEECEDIGGGCFKWKTTNIPNHPSCHEEPRVTISEMEATLSDEIHWQPFTKGMKYQSGKSIPVVRFNVYNPTKRTPIKNLKYEFYCVDESTTENYAVGGENSDKIEHYYAKTGVAVDTENRIIPVLNPGKNVWLHAALLFAGDIERGTYHSVDCVLIVKSLEQGIEDSAGMQDYMITKYKISY